jgi:sulfane dehydrogenase subunit SoxC
LDETRYDGDAIHRSHAPTLKLNDPLPNGTARQFSFVMDAKSIITSPAHPARLKRGWHAISGIAWTGRGRIARVDVSTDGGRTRSAAELQTPILPKAQTRFRHMWEWTGGDATLMSRATDETAECVENRQAHGLRQPLEARGDGREELGAERRSGHGHSIYRRGPDSTPATARAR